MTPSEIAFLGLGLVLGAGIGAALAQVLRGRPSTRREVRLTITPNAIPAARTRTLAVPRATPHPGPIPGSPDAVAADDESGTAGTAGSLGVAAREYRTRVPSPAVTLPSSAVAIPVERAGSPAAPLAESPPGSPSGPPTPGAGPGTAGTAPGASGSDVPGASLGPKPPRASADPRPTGRHPAIVPPSSQQLAPVGPGREPVVAGARPSPTGTAGRAGIALAEAPAQTPAEAPPGAFTTLVRPRLPTDDVRPTLAATAVAVADRTAADRATAGRTVAAPPRALPSTRLAAPSDPTLTRPDPGVTPAVRPRAEDGDALGETPAPGGGAAQPDEAPCAGQRRMVEERCALAGVAGDQAKAAATALQEARRAYDVLRERVDRSASLADPRRIADEKDRLHADFRASTDRADGPDETEAAARAWLDEINALNAAVREASREAEQGSGELRAALPALDRLSAEADAARIASENAEGGCRDARQALADCEEAEQRRQPAPPPDEPHPFAHVWPVDQPEMPDPRAAASPAEGIRGLPAISRILRGDREARDRLVMTLAAGDGNAVQEWQLRVSRLVDAIVGRAIEDGYLDLPADDPFWRLFEPSEARDIVGALSALGFRYDGLGTFADGRVPAARDLSLAVGYAGLDRMRIRTWPPEAGLATLYARAEVAADEWLSDQAGDLSLGRMVDALGGRAAELADVWNAWGRVRPALLATSA